MDPLSSQLEAAGHGLSEFQLLSELRIFHAEDSDGYPDPALELVLATDTSPPTMLTIRAIGVRDFRIGFSGRPIQIEGLKIASIADRQLEGLSWQVSDDERDVLFFQCRAIEFVSLGTPTDD